MCAYVCPRTSEDVATAQVHRMAGADSRAGKRGSGKSENRRIAVSTVLGAELASDPVQEFATFSSVTLFLCLPVCFLKWGW